MKVSGFGGLRTAIFAVLLAGGLAGMAIHASAQTGGPIQAALPALGPRYELIATWDVAKLNRILTEDFPAFSGIKVAYTPARTGVRLYRVTYNSVVPEQANRRIRTTGLVAVPDTRGARLPVLSYQHGTVYGKHEVPSQPEHSPETQLMIAQFAGQGYIVMGADYFGMGDTSEPEGYLVKASHQQATVDMLAAGHDVIRALGFEAGALFLGGWSQGGYVTTALLETLEETGVPVVAAATASAPIDLAASMNGVLFYPRDIDAPWIGTTLILSAFAFENYYNIPGLAASVIKPEHYAATRAAYLREPFKGSDIPTSLTDLVRAEYFDPAFFRNSPYGKLLAETQAYRRVIRVPMRNYYGESDEAIAVGIGRLAMTYQQSLGRGNDMVEAISTGPTDHRGTYAVAAPQWKAWFDTLSR